MSEIVVVAESSAGRSRASQRPLPTSRTTGYVPRPFDSESIPPSLIADIRQFLRLANQIEFESPRAAYLCRFHAFEKAHEMDPKSSGRGVRQFKTSLLQRLEQDENVTKFNLEGKSDTRELKWLLQKYADEYSEILAHGGTESASRERLTRVYAIHSVLLAVLNGISGAASKPPAPGEEKPELYALYNILPLDPGGAQQTIMQLPEIEAAVEAVRNIRGLPLPENHRKQKEFMDILDWLQLWFGFQKGNVDNQREHLILLLANIHVRQIPKPKPLSKLDERAVNELMKKLFKNYKHWCKFLRRKDNLEFGDSASQRKDNLGTQNIQQYKILYIGLYLLIWGEASNLRLMPECLCYIFHHMAHELYGLVSLALSVSVYGGESESFLKNVVTPIYRVIYEEAQKNKSGMADHSQWRNYDDLNEFFWSPNCFQLGWPMHLQHDFFCTVPPKKQCNSTVKASDNSQIQMSGLAVAAIQKLNGYSGVWADFLAQLRLRTEKSSSLLPRYYIVNIKTEVQDKADSDRKAEEDHEIKWLGKTNFVEIRSFWHLFRSFDRMWTFFILILQVMIIMAFHGLGSIFQFVNVTIFEDIVSIFITSAVLRLIQAIFDVVFIWKARMSMPFSQILRYVMKIIVAVIWTISLPVTYVDSKRNASCSTRQFRSGFGEWCFSSYMIAITIYLFSNALGMVLFFVPALSSHIETSNWRICSLLSWWAQVIISMWFVMQPQLYVGRGMQERLVSAVKYTLFWGLLLLSKFSFSYHFEVKPLVEPTKQIMKIGVSKYEWHELFPKVKNNAGAIVAIWAPIILVYFMDTQIWYSVLCTIIGGVYGIFHHMGEVIPDILLTMAKALIHTMGMLRSRFHTLPAAFNVRLIPPLARKEHKTNIRSFLQKKFCRTSVIEKNGAAKFTQVWNQIITTFRSEDLINNREMDLLIIPLSSELSAGRIQWPAFLLAAKLSAAVDMVKEFSGKDDHLYKRIRKDSRMHSAIVECYETLKSILELLVVRELEKRVISEIISEVETSISRSIFLSNFEMSKLSVLCDKCAALVQLLIKNETSHQHKVVRLLQDIFEVITRDMMTDARRIFDLILQLQPTKDSTILFATPEPELFGSLGGNNAIQFPLRNTVQQKQKMKRLLLLLTAKESALDIPKNLEARRRISFFATSLFMDMPTAPRVQDMLSFSVMTPYFTEEVAFSQEELDSTQNWVPIIVYMETIYPDEWRNFLERMGCENLDNAINELQNWESYRGQSLSRTDEWKKCLERMGIKKLNEFINKLRDWASYRGPTLSRTVRGMMYYRKALKLQAFLDMAENENLLEGYKGAEREHDKKNSQHPLSAKLDALADMKFTYVISCQMFAKQKASREQCAADILELMTKYPSLRVAYIEEKEELTVDKTRKEYSSVLIKAVDRLEQEIYRVKLPGPPIIGEGKPENQNHAIIFTRGDVLQTIDMNQDNYMEEAFKMRNILQEFVTYGGERPPTILGLREHIFTGSVSSLAGFMSYQETSFVTIGQRLLADPLRVRFHYGHPDLFDRVFHLTRGGISKASKTINLSEDVFAGFNSTLRQGHITYREYMQVGKGRDVGLNQITKFEAKVANGNSEQTLSRDIYRLGRCFDFFRMLSCYFTTLGFYSNTLISMIGIYVFLYGQLYLILSGLERTILNVAGTHNIKSLETALASQSFIQLGLLTGLPMLMEIGLEKGFRTAFNDFILMQMQLSAVFFTFSLGTKFHYYGRTMLHGGAKYRPTGRKFVVFHASFTENYRLYSRSHFVKGFELMFLLIIYHSFRHRDGIISVLATFSIWFMVGTWLFAPFLFNPSGFEWHKVVEDWKDWNKWIKHQGGIGIQPDKSWESWWNEEQTHLRHSGCGGRIAEVLLSIRFFIYQYGLVYHLDISQENKTVMVYILSWVVIGSILLFVKALELGRELLSAEFHLLFRLFKAVLFLGAFSILITLFAVCKLSMADLFVCSLAFLPTGWGLLLIAQALRPMIEKYGSWDSIRVLSKAYDCGMGLLLFVPLSVLSWLPFMPDFQTRLLFNPAFNKHLHVEMILGRKHKEI